MMMNTSTLRTMAVAVLALTSSVAAQAEQPTAFVDTTGYLMTPPAALPFAVNTPGCAAYDPSTADWAAVRQDILNYLGQSSALIGPEQVPYKRVAAMLVRASFHDAGAFENGVGGADGSLICNDEEQMRRANGAPLKFVPYVRAALAPLAEKYSISYADAIAVGGAVAAEFLGHGSDFALKVGRCDSAMGNPNVLPKDDINYGEFLHYFNSVGIDIADAAALMGSHTVLEDGEGHSDGEQQYKWGATYFNDQLTGTISVLPTVDPATGRATQQVEWSTGKNWQYTINDALIAPQNVDAARRCPFSRMYKRLVKQFAMDPTTWEAAYASAYTRMTEIGATWSDKATDISL